MKTPRYILFARHHAATPKLDSIRKAVIAEELSRHKIKEQKSGFVAWLQGCFQIPWRELVVPSRRIWTGLAAVWLVLLLANLSQRDSVSSVTGQPVHTPPTMMSWQVQPRLMNQVLADRIAPPDMDRPQNVSPRPRTKLDGNFIA